MHADTSVATCMHALTNPLPHSMAVTHTIATQWRETGKRNHLAWRSAWRSPARGFGQTPSRAPHHRAAFLKACITAIKASGFRASAVSGAAPPGGVPQGMHHGYSGFGVGRGFLSA